MKDFSYITNSSPAFIENLYQDFLKNPDSVDPELKKFFEGFDFAINNSIANGNGKSVSTSRNAEQSNAASSLHTSTPLSADVDWIKEISVYRLISGYRNKGHLIAKTNPIRERKDRGANIDLAFYGLNEADLGSNFYAGNLVGLGTTSLKNILAHLEKCYAFHIGAEFKYISEPKKID